MRVFYVALMSTPFIYFSLGAGLKENFIVAALPIAITAWREFRSFQARLLLIIVTIIGISFDIRHMQYYRERVWIPGDNIAISQVSHEFLATKSPADDVAIDGARKFLARSNAMYHRGWAVDITDNEGIQPVKCWMNGIKIRVIHWNRYSYGNAYIAQPPTIGHVPCLTLRRDILRRSSLCPFRHADDCTTH